MKDENNVTSTDGTSNDNLNYSFDFGGQINNETSNVADGADSKLVDVSVPVMDASADSAPAMEVPETTMTQENAAPATLEDVSTSNQDTSSNEKNPDFQDVDDGKSTFKFVMVIVVIIAAFIASLPFILKTLG